MNSPLLALPNLNGENANGNSSGVKHERTNGDDENGPTRPSGGIPGPLKSPLAAFPPYAPGFNMNQALAAQASRILASRIANLPGKFAQM